MKRREIQSVIGIHVKKSLKVKEREEGSHGAKRLGKEKQTTLHKQHKRKHGKV